MSKLAKRLFFGTLMILGLAALLVSEGFLDSRNWFLAAVNVKGLGLTVLVALFVAAGCVELAKLARGKGLRPPMVVMMVTATAVASVPVWAGALADWLAESSMFGNGSVVGGAVTPAGITMVIVTVGLLGGALWQGLRCGNEGALGNLGMLCFAVVYLGLGCSFVVRIRLFGAGSESAAGQIAHIVTFLATVKSADIGAYLIGRKLGRHKWVPSISPAKTWEGFGGGVVLSMIVASLFGRVFGIMGLAQGLAFGMAVAVAGQLGDLLESMLKRDAGSKDSASLVPEFGGVLDILDSIVVAAPFAYGLLLLWA